MKVSAVSVFGLADEVRDEARPQRTCRTWVAGPSAGCATAEVTGEALGATGPGFPQHFRVVAISVWQQKPVADVRKRPGNGEEISGFRRGKRRRMATEQKEAVLRLMQPWICSWSRGKA